MLYFLAVISLFINTALASKLYCVDHHTQTLTSCKNVYIRPISAFATSQQQPSTPKDPPTITFDLDCQAGIDDCEGARVTLEKAAGILSSVIQLETSLVVNATFTMFCSESAKCNKSAAMSAIGQAFPTISYIMTDKADNVTRMYPQALLKQFTQLHVKPGWAKYDINAQFNSGVNWYFANNPNPIQSNQNDFLRNVVHELIHGLGFMSSWSNILYTNMSPLIDDLLPFATPMSLSTLNQNPIKNYDQPFPFWGFIENPFDKLIYFEGTSLGTLTQQLNSFGESNTLFNNALDFSNAWYTSDQYPIARKLYNTMVTSRDLTIKAGNASLWLESSLNPMSFGSSLSHVDSSYINTSEYLMVYMANRGVSIHNNIIGPELQVILANLGYNVRGVNRIKLPSLTYWSPPNDLAGSSSNPTPSLVSKSGPAHSPASQTTTETNSALSVSPYILFCIISNSLIFIILVL